jgi:hypothetical protein
MYNSHGRGEFPPARKKVGGIAAPQRLLGISVVLDASRCRTRLDRKLWKFFSLPFYFSGFRPAQPVVKA